MRLAAALTSRCVTPWDRDGLATSHKEPRVRQRAAAIVTPGRRKEKPRRRQRGSVRLTGSAVGYLVASDIARAAATSSNALQAASHNGVPLKTGSTEGQMSQEGAKEVLQCGQNLDAVARSRASLIR